MATFYPRDTALHNSRPVRDFNRDEMADSDTFVGDLSDLHRNSAVFVARNYEGNEVSDMLDLSKG
jgi:hypothetical protein